MDIRSNQYIKLRYVGAFVAEDYVSLIEGDIKDINIESLVVGAQLFYKKEYLDLEGEAFGHSPFVYIGRKLNLEDVKYEYGNNSILYDNMRVNGYKYVVKTRCGTHYFLDDKDIVVDTPSAMLYQLSIMEVM